MHTIVFDRDNGHCFNDNAPTAADARRLAERVVDAEPRVWRAKVLDYDGNVVGVYRERKGWIQ